MTTNPDLGWLVGTVNNSTSTWAFALNVDMESADGELDLAVRQALARELLELEEILPSG